MSNYLSQFNYQLYGPESGRTWVFLHGLMGYGNNWRKIATSLAATERVLIFDQRGHGKSFRPLSGYAPADYAEDLYHILQELHWSSVVLVGHSMGGRNALAFASQYPQMVSHLVIEDIGPEGKPEAIAFYQNLFSRIPTPFASRQMAREFFTQKFSSIWTKKEAQAVGAFLLSNMEEMADGRLDWRFSPQAMVETVTLGRATDQWNELRSLPMPTLIIRGEQSDELSRDEYKKMLLANPRIGGVEVANAGHWAHFDQPEAFLAALLEFVGA